MKIYIFLLLSLFNTAIFADANTTNFNEISSIDATHNYLSNKVINLSESIDKYISRENDKDRDRYMKNNHIETIDAFFKSEKFLNETKDTYVNIQMSADFQSKEDALFKPGISARIPLSRSKKRFKLYINSIDQDKEGEITDATYRQKHSTPEIGLSYFASNRFDLKSRYSLGTRGFNPFAKVRYSIKFDAGKWDIEPAQLFKLSIKDEFEEETVLYFDRKVKEADLFRIVLNRRTKSKDDGMDYAFALQYYWFIKKDRGVNISQTFSGNTKYEHITYNAQNKKQSQIYSGINNYTTSISWRDNIWKKWLFYEIKPSVNFHKQYNYEENYAVKFSLYYYIGYLK